MIKRSARLWIRDTAEASMMMVQDPVTFGSMAATAVGGALSASGTLAGGSYAAQAGQMQETAANYQAAQLDQNASQAIASSQRQMLDTNLKTSLAESTSTANAAANGVNAGTGSAATNVGNLAARGRYKVPWTYSMARVPLPGWRTRRRA